MSDVADILAELDNAKKFVRGIQSKQIFSDGARSKLRGLAESYFANIRSRLPQATENPILIDLDAAFRELHALSRKNASKQKCLALLTNLKRLLVGLEGAALEQAANHSAGSVTKADSLILSTLQDICPSAALSYQQALLDLTSLQRYSWRGPATDLREAMRETLDILAPDKDVESMPGYKPEADAKHPTMKQKVRYILRNRGMGTSQIATPETAVAGVEDMLGGLTRSVYSRSSVSTHTPTTRAEVLRVHAWVRLVLCELLELPV